MPGISDIWSKFALLKFKLSTCCAVSRCQGAKGDEPLASSQLFRSSCSICLVLWYLDHESKRFFGISLCPYFLFLWDLSSQAAAFFQTLLEDPPQRVSLQMLTPHKAECFAFILAELSLVSHHSPSCGQLNSPLYSCCLWPIPPFNCRHHEIIVKYCY